ncbi:zinc-binding dehydrogenase [Streptosporangium sp. NPDC005286]|uniref:zinc-binding dehydrogenase n=1 Tax=Streptosporangium sp. NPDC005286 TaxID=3154463 RepID=UPI0033B79469
MANAGQNLALTAAAARPGGRIVSPLGGPQEFPCGVNAVFTGTAAATAGQLDVPADQAAHGTLNVPISAEYAFADARQALIDFAERHVQGKITITF